MKCELCGASLPSRLDFAPDPLNDLNRRVCTNCYTSLPRDPGSGTVTLPPWEMPKDAASPAWAATPGLITTGMLAIGGFQQTRRTNSGIAMLLLAALVGLLALPVAINGWKAWAAIPFSHRKKLDAILLAIATFAGTYPYLLGLWLIFAVIILSR